MNRCTRHTSPDLPGLRRCTNCRDTILPVESIGWSWDGQRMTHRLGCWGGGIPGEKMSAETVGATVGAEE